MNTDAPSSESAAPAASVATSSAPAARPPRKPVEHRPRGGALALAVLLSLIAVGGAGYVFWQQWQQTRGNASTADTVASLVGRVGTLESTLKTVEDERRSLRDRLRDTDDVNRGMREELLGQNERLRNLEDAVAKLSEKSLSGHDAMLLDEAELLLRMGQERYTLFHDAAGAAQAYALADQALASVNDGAFSGLRQSLGAEREALVASEAAHPASALQQLQQLRAGIADWPLRPLDEPDAGSQDSIWGRIRSALSSVLTIQRDNGAPLAIADARLTRELAALDLADAEAALLAHDPDGYLAALKRVDAGLAAQFDPAAEDVRHARGMLATLIRSAQSAKPVELGAALSELRNLRAVHTLKPAAEAKAPATATSAGARP